MTIRKHVIDTWQPSFYKEISRPKYKSGLFTTRLTLVGYENVREYIPGAWAKTETLEWLNPETAKWEPLPTVREEVYAPERKSA